MSSFSNVQQPATNEQIEAAKDTIELATNIKKFIIQSQAVEKSNKHLTWFIIFLSIIQAFSAILVINDYFKYSWTTAINPTIKIINIIALLIIGLVIKVCLPA